MTLDVDTLLERRRMKRRLALWRGAAVIAALAVAMLLASRGDGVLSALGFGSHIARVTISGLITDDRAQQELLTKLAEARQAEAVILHVDSLGGTTAGGEALYVGLRRLAEKKPVVAVFGTTATSAGYMAGIAADHIIARGNTITGSVGVILQWAEVSELLRTLGVKVEEIKSGPLKATPSLFQPTDPAGRALVEEMVQESKEWFVNLVVERRATVRPRLGEIASGRIYSGRQALEIGLIDEIGDETTARAWLNATHGLSTTMTVVDWKPETSVGFGLIEGAAAALAGLADGSIRQLVTFFAEYGRRAVKPLDGLISLWHPQK